MVPFTSLPIIDITPLVEKNDDPRLGELEDVAEVVKLLDKACRDVGFFYVKGHGISSSLCEDVLQVSREFFNCSYEDKLKIKMTKDGGFRGYQRLGENVTKGRPDMHEAIDYYKEFDCEAYGELGHTMYGPNRWPENPKRFKSVMQEYLKAVEGLSKKLLRGIALALGGPPDAFERDKASDPFWVMRVIGYPPLDNKDHETSFDESGISCGAHTDYGLLTFVNQDAEPCALQVRNQVGEWVWAPPITGTLVVNIGDMLRIFSNGIYESTLHRVINNNSIYRVSVPFFLEPNYDAAVVPFEFCKKATGNQDADFSMLKPVVYGEHLVKKVLTNF